MIYLLMALLFAMQIAQAVYFYYKIKQLPIENATTSEPKTERSMFSVLYGQP